MKKSNLDWREHPLFKKWGRVSTTQLVFTQIHTDWYQWQQSSFHEVTKWQPGRIWPHNHFSNCATPLFVPHSAKGKTSMVPHFSLSFQIYLYFLSMLCSQIPSGTHMYLNKCLLLIPVKENVHYGEPWHVSVRGHQKGLTIGLEFG